jgi:hypothetical protein
MFVTLLSYNHDRSNVAQQDEDGCEQTVFEISNHRSDEECRGSQKNEQGAPWIPPCCVRPDEIWLAPTKNQLRSKTRKVNRNEQY